jgi:hypothetical protein
MNGSAIDVMGVASISEFGALPIFPRTGFGFVLLLMCA